MTTRTKKRTNKNGYFQVADMPIQQTMCATCPFREGSPHEYLRSDLAVSALTDATRECHSTGSNAINACTGKPPRICRGARDVQLKFFAGIGFLPEPTDKAWADKVAAMKNNK